MLLTSITVLHPRHKLAYFKSANWELEWIKSAEKIVCKKYEHSYASRNTSIDHGDEVEILSKAPSVRTIPLYVCKSNAVAVVHITERT